MGTPSIPLSGTPTVLSVNLGSPVPTDVSAAGTTCIHKHPVDHPVAVTAPGPRTDGPPGGSGLAGDAVSDRRHHGGDDQAVYAYAREDLDFWQQELGRELPAGVFGENLTTTGLDLGACRIGERWQVGATLVLEVSRPRIPCRTFAEVLAERGWVRRFTQEARTGTYLRVVVPGPVAAGDRIVVLSRPEHDVTIHKTFRAFTLEPDLLPELWPAADALAAEDLAKVRRRTTPAR